jgi:Regulator of chromosome condensation (RCC1) repeat
VRCQQYALMPPCIRASKMHMLLRCIVKAMRLLRALICASTATCLMAQSGPACFLMPVSVCCRRSGAPRLSAVSLQGGKFHSAYLMNNGALYTCGKTANGRLGMCAVLAMAQAQAVDVDNLPSISVPHIVEAFQPRLNLSAGQYVTYVTCGDAHTMAISLSGRLMVWGENVYGQLGTGDTCACSYSLASVPTL